MHEWIDGGGSLNPKWSHRIPGWKDSPGHCILGYSDHEGGGGGHRQGRSPNPLTPSRSQAHLHLWEPHPHELRHDHVVPSPKPRSTSNTWNCPMLADKFLPVWVSRSIFHWQSVWHFDFDHRERNPAHLHLTASHLPYIHARLVSNPSPSPPSLPPPPPPYTPLYLPPFPTLTVIMEAASCPHKPPSQTPSRGNTPSAPRTPRSHST